MEIGVSNLFCMGLYDGKLNQFSAELGIEVFAECGSEYHWNHLLPQVMEGRSAFLSIHGPFQHLDLSDPNGDFEEMKQAYIQAFELCRKFHAKHCVCHPYDGGRPEDDTEEALALARQTSLERVLYLNKLAKQYGVELLVENMPEKNGMLDEMAFLELFAPHEELHFLIDTGHANLLNWDMMIAFERLGSRIKGYHLHDNHGDADSHLKVWEGTFDWEVFFRGYKKYSPDAVLVCEYYYGPVEEIIESANRIRSYLDQVQI